MSVYVCEYFYFSVIVDLLLISHFVPCVNASMKTEIQLQ
jgi:hypothetical protein